MFQMHLIKDEYVEPLAEGCMDVLEKVGALVQNAEMLKLLDEAGALVDYDAQRVRFPRKMVADFCEKLRAEGPYDIAFDLYGDAEGTGGGDAGVSGKTSGMRPQPRFQAPPMPTLGTQIAQIYYDYETGQRRQGNRGDLVTLTKLADVLHPDVAAGHSLVQTEVPGMMEALESALVLAEYAHKPGQCFAWFVEQVDYLKEMGEVLGIDDWYTWGSVCIAHPLRFDKAVADKFVRRVREGFPTGLTAMPIAGFTTPVTAEGFIVVSAAENVAAWLMARVINPDCPLSGSMWAGSVDMATGAISFSAFDSMYLAAASVEFQRKWTGINMPIGGGEYCDAKEPGLYAAIEKAYKSMTIAAFTGQHPTVGEGLLECGRTMCPVQLLIDRDMALGVLEFGRSIDPTPEKIGIDEILNVDFGMSANHLQSLQTAQFFRQSLWLPKVVDRAGWTGAAGDKQLLEKTQAAMNKMLQEYQKPEGREDQLAEMRRIVERARRELLG